MYCLRRCFTRTTLFTTMFTVIIVVCSLKSMCITRTTLFTTMFTVIIVVCSLKSMCIPSFVLIGCCVSELHGHLCPYRNVWPEAVYCCFTRTTLFTTMFTVIIVVCSLKSMCVPSFILIGCCVSELHGHLCAHCNVWPEAVYCCFTRTTLFIKLFTCLYDQS